MYIKKLEEERNLFGLQIEFLNRYAATLYAKNNPAIILNRFTKLHNSG